MSQSGKHSIGDEIPYRRDQIDKRTGSLVFDQHLNEKLSEAPQQSEEQSVAGDTLTGDTPLKPGQVT